MNAPVLEYKDIYIARPTSGSPSSVDQGRAGCLWRQATAMHDTVMVSGMLLRCLTFGLVEVWFQVVAINNIQEGVQFV